MFKKTSVTVSSSTTIKFRKIGLLMFAFVFIFVSGITMSVDGSIDTVNEVGEIVLIQGFTGQSVNVEVNRFVVDPDPSSPPWNDERVNEHMVFFYEAHPYLKEINIPKIDSWKLDPVILWNMKLVIGAEKFLDLYKGELEAGQAYANAYLRNTLSKFTSDSSALEQYFVLLSEYIETKLGSSSFFAPIERDTHLEGISVD